MTEIEDMKIRIINQCDDLESRVFDSIGFIQLETMVITLTDRVEEFYVPYILHHEYFHAILYKVIDLEASSGYDNICECGEMI